MAAPISSTTHRNLSNKHPLTLQKRPNRPLLPTPLKQITLPRLSDKTHVPIVDAPQELPQLLKTTMLAVRQSVTDHILRSPKRVVAQALLGRLLVLQLLVHPPRRQKEEHLLRLQVLHITPFPHSNESLLHHIVQREAAHDAESTPNPSLQPLRSGERICRHVVLVLPLKVLVTLQVGVAVSARHLLHSLSRVHPYPLMKPPRHLHPQILLPDAIRAEQHQHLLLLDLLPPVLLQNADGSGDHRRLLRETVVLAGVRAVEVQVLDLPLPVAVRAEHGVAQQSGGIAEIAGVQRGEEQRRRAAPRVEREEEHAGAGTVVRIQYVHDTHNAARSVHTHVRGVDHFFARNRQRLLHSPRQILLLTVCEDILLANG